jgi:hypothetical protein
MDQVSRQTSAHSETEALLSPSSAIPASPTEQSLKAQICTLSFRAFIISNERYWSDSLLTNPDPIDLECNWIRRHYTAVAVDRLYRAMVSLCESQGWLPISWERHGCEWPTVQEYLDLV